MPILYDSDERQRERPTANAAVHRPAGDPGGRSAVLAATTLAFTGMLTIVALHLLTACFHPLPRIPDEYAWHPNVVPSNNPHARPAAFGTCHCAECIKEREAQWA